ncbi:MAG TPA: sigma-70 family RNA polymerase sigma factor [Spirochaetota bacterium]|nr:sigma-70 family RNA polymerase sigma factor [Spirochaetota bacterium]
MNRKNKTTSRPDQNDESLIRSFLSDDPDAFDLLVIKYKDMIFNLCYRIVNDYDDANDCAQETFIKVYKNMRQFRFQSSFSTWLYRIAINTCRNRIASSGNRIRKKMLRIDNPGEAGSDTVDIHDCSFSPDSVFEKNEQARLIHQAIDALPEELKVLVVLRDLEGNSYEDIADITGVNLGTVKSRLARARHLLRESLREVI